MIGQVRRAILVKSLSPKRTRRRYTAEFKAEVALAALTECQPLAELAAHYHAPSPAGRPGLC